jgi:hypothetical protein
MYWTMIIPYLFSPVLLTAVYWTMNITYLLCPVLLTAVYWTVLVLCLCPVHIYLSSGCLHWTGPDRNLEKISQICPF